MEITLKKKKSNFQAIKILVIGTDGLVGSQMFSSFRRLNFEVIGTTRNIKKLDDNKILFDLSYQGQIDKLPFVPDVTYICAGITNISTCESEPEHSNKVNVINTISLISQLHELGSFIVYLSSNQVFDGRKKFVLEKSEYNPSTLYGEQKVIVEKHLFQLSRNFAIVRLTKIVGDNYPIIRQWINDLMLGNTIEPCSNYSMSPVSLANVNDILIQLGSKNQCGIIQLSGDEDISYTWVARRCVELLDITLISLLKPIHCGFISQLFGKQYKYSSMEVSGIDEFIDCPLKNSRKLIEDVIRKQIMVAIKERQSIDCHLPEG